MEATEYIPREHFNLWYEVFKHSNGRFLSEPVECGKRVFVSYKFDDVMDANRLSHSFHSLTKPIVETKRDWWKRIKVKLGL